jgi:hypothetical protein
MLALLESHGATHAQYDRAAPASAILVWLSLLWAGGIWALRTLLAFLVFAPVHLASRVAPGGSRL